MIYFSGIYLVFMSLAWSFCLTAGLTLEEQLEQLKVSHRYFILIHINYCFLFYKTEMREALALKDRRLEALERQIEYVFSFLHFQKLLKLVH